MSEENILELLNRDLDAVDTTTPLLKHGSKVLFNIASCKMVPTKDGTSQNVEVVLKLVADSPNNKGGFVKAGSQLTHRISLKLVDKNGDRRDQPNGPIQRDLARFRKAVTGSQGGAFLPCDQYIGRQVMATVSIEKDATGQYGDQNRIARWEEPK